MSGETVAAAVHVDRAVELMSQLGETIETLNELGCIVQLETWFNDGSESVTLDRLNGEFRLEIGTYQSLTEQLK